MSGRGIYVALSGAVAQQTALDTTAQNLANAQTEGFLRTRVAFREVLARAERGGRFVSASETALDTTQGALRTTGRALDAALPAGTFLAVSTPRGERYTRTASLRVHPDGTLLTARGQAVLREQDGKPMRVDPAGPAPELSRTGAVVQGGQELGRIRVVRFDLPARLAHEEGALLAANAASGEPRPVSVELEVGALEESNSDVTAAMTEIVTATRTFEAYERAIQTFSEVDKKLVTSVPGAT